MLCTGSRMGCPENISNFQNMNALYVALNHVIWKCRICYYFREIFGFRDFMNTLRNFVKSVFARIFAKFKYFVFRETIYVNGSPDHVL